jgi:lipid-A-disaccharide synthase-like uncharacterized protein
MNITYCISQFVALYIQHEMPMCYIVICGLSGSAVLFHFIRQRQDYIHIIEHNMYNLIFSASSVCIISYLKQISTRI